MRQAYETSSQHRQLIIIVNSLGLILIHSRAKYKLLKEPYREHVGNKTETNIRKLSGLQYKTQEQ